MHAQLRTIYCNTYVYTFQVCLCLLALTFVSNSIYLLKCSFQIIISKSIVVFIRSSKVWFKTTSRAKGLSHGANVYLPILQTFVTNLHLWRVELRCKLPGKLHRVTGPLAHDVVLNHTYGLLINTTMLFWYIWNEHFNK